MIPYIWNWKIEKTGINTDYLIVSITILNPWQPQAGAGRYAMLISLLNNNELKTVIRLLGARLQLELENMMLCTELKNPQMLFRDFKKDLVKEA